jgi:hypothetical protein
MMLPWLMVGLSAGIFSTSCAGKLPPLLLLAAAAAGAAAVAVAAAEEADVASMCKREEQHRGMQMLMKHEACVTQPLV